MKFSISEVAKKMNLSVSTIRYYDKDMKCFLKEKK